MTRRVGRVRHITLVDLTPVQFAGLAEIAATTGRDADVLIGEAIDEYLQEREVAA